ncbi:hypothetical protein ACGFRG_05700 [Streptomyces sp. NPDC048696]|uniref:hypothetical protein n=1 Tax=Streptomyces sp. NPDC048696 TaxID=3365585 RepID=UPI00371D386B
MIKDLSRGSEGVTEAADLKVTPLPVPGAGVQIADGSAVIRGRANAWQGSYTAYNIGTATVPIAPTSAGAGRSDLIVLRVQDPEFEGGKDPATDAINTFDVIPNVGKATSLPAGVTGIALARIDIPASTGTITAGMITDLRQVALPRRERTQYLAFPHELTKAWKDDEQWHDWPAPARWQIRVPEWATSVIFSVTVAGLRLDYDNVYGIVRPLFGSVVGQGVVVNDEQGKVVRRNTLIVADTLTLPPAFRGTSQPLYLQARMAKTVKGDLGVDEGSTIVADVEFIEGPV